MSARICPENGATVSIILTYPSRKEIRKVEDPGSDFADGLLLIALANQRHLEIENGVAEIPEGATVELYHDQVLLCVLDVYRNNTPPMYHKPGDDHPHSKKPRYHHVDGDGYFGSSHFPDPLNAKVAIWCHNTEQQE